MIEDIMDYDRSNGIYKQQAPLRPPPMNPPTSVRASLSPRFDNIVARSSSNPWAPAPLDGNQYDRTSADPFSTSHTFTKSSEVWTNNNPHTKSSDAWLNNNVHNKSPDAWLHNNPQTKSSDVWLHNNPQTKSSDTWLNNNPQIKSSDAWSANNMFTKTTDSTLISNNSSNAQMIKSSDKTFGFITDRCSPRCKLGILGFIIGFLVVGIALAVVLVLWLRK